MTDDWISFCKETTLRYNRGDFYMSPIGLCKHCNAPIMGYHSWSGSGYPPYKMTCYCESLEYCYMMRNI